MTSGIPAVFVGSTHVTPPERQALADLRALGLQDVVPTPMKGPHPFTYWDYRAGMFAKNNGMRIDLVYATEAVASRVRAPTWTARPARARGRPTTRRSWWTSAEAEDARGVVVQHRGRGVGRQVERVELGQAPLGREEGIVAAPQELPGQPPAQFADHLGRDTAR